MICDSEKAGGALDPRIHRIGPGVSARVARIGEILATQSA